MTVAAGIETAAGGSQAPGLTAGQAQNAPRHGAGAPAILPATTPGVESFRSGWQSLLASLGADAEIGGLPETESGDGGLQQAGEEVLAETAGRPAAAAATGTGAAGSSFRAGAVRAGRLLSDATALRGTKSLGDSISKSAAAGVSRQLAAEGTEQSPASASPMKPVRGIRAASSGKGGPVETASAIPLPLPGQNTQSFSLPMPAASVAIAGNAVIAAADDLQPKGVPALRWADVANGRTDRPAGTPDRIVAQPLRSEGVSDGIEDRAAAEPTAKVNSGEGTGTQPTVQESAPARTPPVSLPAQLNTPEENGAQQLRIQDVAASTGDRPGAEPMARVNSIKDTATGATVAAPASNSGRYDAQQIRSNDVSASTVNLPVADPPASAAPDKGAAIEATQRESTSERTPAAAQPAPGDAARHGVTSQEADGRTKAPDSGPPESISSSEQSQAQFGGRSPSLKPDADPNQIHSALRSQPSQAVRLPEGSNALKAAVPAGKISDGKSEPANASLPGQTASGKPDSVNVDGTISDRGAVQAPARLAHTGNSFPPVAHGVHLADGQSSLGAQDGTNPVREPVGERGTMGAALHSADESKSTSSTPGPAPRETFAALDAAGAPMTPTWIHAGAQRAEAGYEDPALGWVGVRADLGGGGVHATLMPGTADAAAAIGNHLDGLNAYLAEHHTQVDTVTMAAPESQWAGQGMDQGSSRNMHQGAGQEAPGPDPGSGERVSSSSAAQPALPEGALQVERLDEGSMPAGRWGKAHISVMA